MTNQSKSFAIIARDLALGYGGQIVLSPLTLNIEQGEFIGILGPNGAGKSTLLQALLGLIKPLNGKLEIRATRIGYMPQSRQLSLQASLSGLEFVACVQQGTQWGLPLRNKKQSAELKHVLAMVEADPYAHRPLQQLSGGEQQRLLLAQALLGEPEILLLDEPLAGLDPRHQERLISLIQSIRNQLGITVLFTAHDVNPLLGVMDRVMYMANNRAVIGQVEEIITSENLTALYQSPMEVIHHADRLFVFSYEQSGFEHAHH
ncbi:MAG: metal ABC transporter ATP-binding protein [Gammaproteobacteria bacterium]